LRNHFTIEYEQAVLGSIYVGAAVLIIIIGLRGLQFIPKERPSLVLFAIALEFVLLIAYAVTLMFSPSQESPSRQRNELSEVFGAASIATSPLASVRYS
jgi:arginine exporter protein ArgO